MKLWLLVYSDLNYMDIVKADDMGDAIYSRSNPEDIMFALQLTSEVIEKIKEMDGDVE